MTFTDNGDGTATLAGTPAGGPAAYPITITASNSTGHTDQSFTLTVNQPPTISSADHATFAVGSAGSFTVTTTAGYPAATTLSHTGTLPSGVSFTDNGDGTAMLAGTPAGGTGGSYPITITASQRHRHDADAELHADGQPATDDHQRQPHHVQRRQRRIVHGHHHAGYPAATTLSHTGTLPSGVSFTDNGDGTATLGGTPAGGTGGVYTLSITASNGIAPDGDAELHADGQPAADDHQRRPHHVRGRQRRIVHGHHTAGYPAATTLSHTGTCPAACTFTDNGDGTGTLAGTPAGGTGGVYDHDHRHQQHRTHRPELHADGQPAADDLQRRPHHVRGRQRRIVHGHHHRRLPRGDHAQPHGTLPSGVSFTDNGDGTATLAGTPAGGAGGSYRSRSPPPTAPDTPTRASR